MNKSFFSLILLYTNLLFDLARHGYFCSIQILSLSALQTKIENFFIFTYQINSFRADFLPPLYSCLSRLKTTWSTS